MIALWTITKIDNDKEICTCVLQETSVRFENTEYIEHFTFDAIAALLFYPDASHQQSIWLDLENKLSENV